MCCAYIPPVHNGDDTTLIDADLQPGRLRHVEVWPPCVAPAAVVVREVVVRRAEVGGRDRHRNSRLAEPGFRPLAVARDLVALPAGGAVVEEHGAQRRRPRPVPRRVQVPVAARSTCVVRDAFSAVHTM